MKKTIMALAVLLAAAPAFAQKTAEEFKAQYERQVGYVGTSGVGVENILNKWAEAYPEDCDMLEARFSYWLGKSFTNGTVVKQADKYLGNKPVVTLKDSLGNDVNYFEDLIFTDTLYAKADQYITQAISIKPDELKYRFQKLNALLSYEKDCPDLTLLELSALIDRDSKSRPAWTYRGEPAEPEMFVSAVQEYCNAFFRLGSAGGYDAFRIISEKMNKLNPKSTLFLSNLGTYWLVAKNDSKKALNYYNKVLKINPKDYAAIKNCVLMARKNKDVKLEKKYLPMLIEVAEDAKEKASAEARLKAL